MPSWVQLAWDEYSKRMPAHCSLQLKEIAAGKRGKNADIKRILDDEAKRLWSAVSRDAFVVALDRSGKSVDSKTLAQQLELRLQEGRDWVFLIGGPEGLTQECLGKADVCWSLSAMTMAHPVVRVVLAEQLYRAWSISAGLPYHR
jgi:23S rRNA (pseudouridine1915-N3)-methyltransferase